VGRKNQSGSSGCCLTVWRHGPPTARGQAPKPNVVFILVDNVGWGAFGAYGGTVPTPRIDKLASEGIRFINYNVEAQCTPSRSAIHTGRYSVRSGTFTVPWPGQGLAGLAPWEYTIAELHSDSGCHCVIWQMAPGEDTRPFAERSRLRRVVGHKGLLGRGRLYRMAAVQREWRSCADYLGRKEG
jgi:hypothetical protein